MKESTIFLALAVICLASVHWVLAVGLSGGFFWFSAVQHKGGR